MSLFIIIIPFIFYFETVLANGSASYEDELVFFESPGLPVVRSDNTWEPKSIICHGDLENDVHVQLLFAFDITTSTKPVQYIAKDFVSQIEAFAEDMDKAYWDAEYALTYHANWPRTAFYEEHPRGHNMNEACYIRKTHFLRDVFLIKTIAEKTNQSIGGPSSSPGEATLPAVAFAAVDPLVGWKQENADGKGRLVQRFIVMYTDDDSIFFLDKPGERTEFRRDGTDSCSTTYPPSYEVYTKIFTEKNIKVIGILENKELEDIYLNHFREIKTPFCSIVYNSADSFRRIKYCMDSLIRCSP